VTGLIIPSDTLSGRVSSRQDPITTRFKDMLQIGKPSQTCSFRAKTTGIPSPTVSSTINEPMRLLMTDTYTSNSMHLLAKERDGGLKSELILCLSLLPAEADTTSMNIVDLVRD
jgi:hypothetical protein